MGDDKSYDSIIVGAGMAGLTCAAYLCRQGYKVLVCEKEDHAGGLVGSFDRDGFTFDAGIRAFEDTGIIRPMLNQLGISIDFVSNPVTVGIEDIFVLFESKNSLADYQAMLAKVFPEQTEEIKNIMAAIEMTMRYMDVIYGIDNPLFLEDYTDRTYLMKTLLPWLLSYQRHIKKIRRLSAPINDYLLQMTQNKSLIDMITQHFFDQTPAFFALSYFGLYLDYCYPKGGTGVLVDRMLAYIKENGGEVLLSCQIDKLDAHEKYVLASDGRKLTYRNLIWCADMRSLYHVTDTKRIKRIWAKKRFFEKKQMVNQGRGSDSVLSIYLSVDMDKQYFASRCNSHAFYTPNKSGLHTVGRAKAIKKATKWTWLSSYLEKTTYEISCPALRDPTLAPNGQTGLMISTRMDYDLVKSMADSGEYDAFKTWCTNKIIDVLDQSIFPGIKTWVIDVSCTTPMSIESVTGNYQGAITGWAFSNSRIPAQTNLLKVKKSVLTPLPDVYQAGQWTFSPAGLPIAILTGKLAADTVHHAWRKKTVQNDKTKEKVKH